MNKTLASTFALAAALGVAAPAAAQIAVSDAGFTYSQSFDSLSGTGTTQPWSNNSTLPGWVLVTQAGAAASTLRVGNGSANAGGFYSFGSTGSSDRALGALGSGGADFGTPGAGAVAGWFGVGFTNSSTGSFAGFALGFEGEQWRNANTSAQSMVFEYGFGNTLQSVSQWTAPGAGFSWDSPLTGGAGVATDGNAAGRVTGLGGTIQAAWEVDQTLWLRWTELNDSGNDHALAIDNLQFAVVPVPEPDITAMMLAGLAALGYLGRRRAARD